MSERRYVVLGEGLGDEVFERLEAGLTAIDKRTGLLFGYSLMQEAEAARHYVYRELADQPALITLVEDAAIPAMYVMIETEDPRHAEAIEEELAAHLPAVPLEELQRRADAPSAEPGALMRLALATGAEPDPGARATIGRALESPDPAVQESAIMAAALTRDPELIPALERLRDATPDDGLKAIANQAISDSGGEAS